ncbi:hypothetical protein RclHR1_01740012 [Rhizophagus clarus]|uniref:Uncharacterized protein n=1 Tax=Rhizophagus clarus TaxID=94130 RepID=A0A2Z6QLD1_9GLOM|nr:hypothetical protein RclHR1_01740012 [Rhizophagus clarus]GET02780.1 hypothetical protein GLOIN_2v1639822 [Rhizophagus clarus]
MISTTRPIISRNNNNNYLVAGKPFLKHQSLMRPVHATNHVGQKNSADSLRYPSSHSSKNERKEQFGKKSSVTNNSLRNENTVMRNNIQRSTENNPYSSNTKRYEHSGRSSKMHNSKSPENNLRLTNSKNRSTEVGGSRISTMHNFNSTDYNSRPVKRTMEVVDDSRSINSKKRSLEIENPVSVENGLHVTKKNSTTHHPTQRNDNEVGNLSRSSTIKNLNRAENNSRLTNPRKRPIGVENNSILANPQKRSRVEIQNDSSTMQQRGSTNNNIRAVTNRSIVVNSGSNPVRRNGTGNDSRTTNSQHSRNPTNTDSLIPVGFDRFSTYALNNKAKNKDLNMSEWENIRLIKAALINLVESSQKYNKIKAGKLTWSKINEWVYDTFYPDLNKYLDRKRINRENSDLVIKAIMDYYVSRHDGYMKRSRKPE